MNKEITLVLEQLNDGSIRPKVKDDQVVELSLQDIYMFYKYLELILNESKFDWNSVEKFNINIHNNK